MRCLPFCLVAPLATFVCLSAHAAPPAPLQSYKVPAAVEDRLALIDISNVTLGGEIGRRVDVTIDNNIKRLNLRRDFTRHFEEKRGPQVVGAFIGMGMLIDATARLAAYSDDEDVLAVKDDLVDTVIDSQLPDGYSGFYAPRRRLWNGPGTGGDNWDIHEMAFLIDGLLTNYQLFGDERSLRAATKTADFILDRWDEMPDDYAKSVDMHVLDTGIDWAILRLYRVTGEPRYLDFSTKRKSLYEWNTPITIGRRRGVSGHMFAYFAMCVAQLELHRLTEDDQLLTQTQNAIDFFLAGNGLTITGSAGQREIWTDDQDGEAELGETCATAYQLRVYENLLRSTGQAIYGDLIERTAYNGLFAAQSPEGDKLRYYTPFEGPRHFYEPQYMCCPGNFRRIVAELPGMVYYRNNRGGVTVNLYDQSTATVALDGGLKVSVTQATDYPTSGRIDLSVEPSEAAQFPVALRIPSWAQKASIQINGQPFDGDLSPGARSPRSIADGRPATRWQSTSPWSSATSAVASATPAEWPSCEDQ